MYSVLCTDVVQVGLPCLLRVNIKPNYKDDSVNRIAESSH